jgi:MscS family membrane protein
VAYGSDVDEVCAVLEKTATDHAQVVKVPAPRVRMRAFGTSSLDFELLVWIDHPELRGRVRHDLLMNLYKALNSNGIEIPFPQTDIHLRSMPEKDNLQD